jgi:hypothetical protein
MLNLRKEDISSALSDLDLMKFILLRQVWSMKRGNHHFLRMESDFHNGETAHGYVKVALLNHMN